MGKTAQALWQDYRFLTQEMVKFLIKQDMSLFYHLRVQSSIEEAADEVFKDSLAGQSLLIEIQKDSQIVIDHLQSRMSLSKRQFQGMKAYSGESNGSVSRKTWER